MEDYLTLRIEKKDNGCNFCSAKDDDLNDDLVVRDLKFPNGTFLIGAHVYITNEGNLELYFDDSYGQPVEEPRRVQIHYCPMCGRKLHMVKGKKYFRITQPYMSPGYSVSSVASMLEVTEETVRRWIRTKKIAADPCKSNKDGYVITADAINDFVSRSPRYLKRFEIGEEEVRV